MSLEAGVERLTFSAISFGAQIDRGPLAARVHMTCRGSSTYPRICLDPHLSDDSLTVTMTKIAKRMGHEAQRSRNCGDPVTARVAASCRRKPAG